MARADHERVLVTYGSAFFRAVLLGHTTTGFLIGRELPPVTPTALVHLSFKQVNALTVDDHEQANTIGTNSLNQPTSQTGVTADEFGMSQTAANRFNDSFFGDSIGMVAVPKRAGGRFRSQLPAGTGITNREIWVRVADVFDGTMPTVASGFELGLELASGVVKWVDSDDVGGVPLPFDYGSTTKSMLATLRFPASCFHLSRTHGRVIAIVLRINRKTPRALAFDDLQIV